MYDLFNSMGEVYDTGSAMQNYANDAVVQEQYRAAIEIYTERMNRNIEIAHTFLKQHKEMNDKIFNDAMSYLDIAIEYANFPLAQTIIELLESMKEREPEFYRKYYNIRFGK